MPADKDALAQILSNARRFRRFPVTRLDLERFLSLLLRMPRATLWDCIRRSDLYIRVILGLLYALEDGGYIHVGAGGELDLTTSGRRLARGLSVRKGAQPFNARWSRYGFRLSGTFAHILDTVTRLYQEVRPQNRYDQAPLVPEAAVCKAAYAVHRGDVTGRSVVCVGDDDLTSIILCLSSAPRDVLVLDIDAYLLETVEEYAERHSLPIQTHKQDLRQPIPAQIRGRYDTFITEPSDTVAGITLFTSRGVECLKPEPGKVGYCGISTTACPPEGLLEVQRSFDRMGLLITDRLPKYSDYPPHRTELKHIEVPDCYDPFYPPQSVWYVSDLLRLQTTKETRPLVRRFRGKLSDYRRDARAFA